MDKNIIWIAHFMLILSASMLNNDEKTQLGVYNFESRYIKKDRFQRLRGKETRGYDKSVQSRIFSKESITQIILKSLQPK